MQIEFLQAQLPKVAKRLSRLFRAGDIVGFSGNLAAGKTTLISEILKTYGYTGRVSSPTFVIEHRYPISDKKIRQIIHLDLYRLNPEDLASLDWKEYDSDDNLVFIEWPERLTPGLINLTKTINIQILNERKRQLTLQEHPNS